MTVSTTDITTEPTPESPADSLPKMGEILREKREEKNLAVEDVSNRLRLSVRQIQALETNNFASFPEAMMTRGFIRNYARFLEIDPDPLLQAYREYVPSESPHSLSLHSANVQLPINGQRSWGKYIVLLVVIALLVGGWIIYEDYLPHHSFSGTLAEAPATSPQAAVEPVPTNEPMPEAALPLAERENEQGAADATGNSVETTAPVAVPPVSTADAVNSAPGQVAAKPAESLNQQVNSEQTKPEQAKPQEASPVASIKLKPDAGTNLLKLKFAFTEESWVSVVDTDGNQVFNKTKPAGSQDVVEAKPPVKLVLGNAAGSQVSYQGKAIDLAPYTRLNVARLTLAVE